MRHGMETVTAEARFLISHVSARSPYARIRNGMNTAIATNDFKLLV